MSAMCWDLAWIAFAFSPAFSNQKQTKSEYFYKCKMIVKSLTLFWFREGFKGSFALVRENPNFGNIFKNLKNTVFRLWKLRYFG